MHKYCKECSEYLFNVDCQDMIHDSNLAVLSYCKRCGTCYVDKYGKVYTRVAPLDYGDDLYDLFNPLPKTIEIK